MVVVPTLLVPLRMTAPLSARKFWPMVSVPPSGELIVTPEPVPAIDPMLIRLPLVGADGVAAAEVVCHEARALGEDNLADDAGAELRDIGLHRAIDSPRGRELRPNRGGGRGRHGGQGGRARAGVRRARLLARPLDGGEVAEERARGRGDDGDPHGEPRGRIPLVERRVAPGQGRGVAQFTRDVGERGREGGRRERDDLPGYWRSCRASLGTRSAR